MLIFLPILFVFLWSTGWIVGKYAGIYGEPLTFLVVRFITAILILAPLILYLKPKWPQGRKDLMHAMFSGVLLHTLYLGGVWYVVKHGLPTGISGLIAAVQPLLTALLANKLAGEKLSPLQIFGICLGFTGVIFVLAPKLMGVDIAANINIPLLVALNIGAMVSCTLGSFYQKRFVSTGDLSAVTFLQYIGALPLMLLMAYTLEDMRFPVTWETMLVLAWAVLVLSIGAVGLMLYMIRQGAISKMAALIFLVPPAVAVEAWLLFGETLTPWQIFGMFVTATGVYFASRK